MTCWGRGTSPKHLSSYNGEMNPTGLFWLKVQFHYTHRRDTESQDLLQVLEAREGYWYLDFLFYVPEFNSDRLPKKKGKKKKAKSQR